MAKEKRIYGCAWLAKQPAGFGATAEKRVRDFDIAESAPRSCHAILPVFSIQIENIRYRAFSGGSTFRNDGIYGSFCYICCRRTGES